MDVSIILVNYNTYAYTHDCVASINQHTKGVEYEIIIVDNNSSQHEKELLASIEGVTVVYSESNNGFGVGNNIGVRSAKGKYVFLLNTDTILLNNAVKSLFDYFESHKEYPIGTLGTWLLSENGTVTNSYGRNFPSAFNFKYVLDFLCRRLHLTQSVKSKEIVDKPKKVNIVIGADMMFPKNLYDAVGGFDGDYFMYGEECELEYRISKMGYDNFIIPGPRIIHKEGKSTGNTGRMNFFQFYSNTRGRLMFYKKHKSKFYCIVAFFVSGLIDLPFVCLDKRFRGKRTFYLKLYGMLMPWAKISPQLKDINLYR